MIDGAPSRTILLRDAGMLVTAGARWIVRAVAGLPSFLDPDMARDRAGQVISVDGDVESL